MAKRDFLRSLHRISDYTATQLENLAEEITRL
jgi:hypothetical protein